ncbi:MAG TPA: hypothetical protein VLT89_03250 [Usitatibacter sp.]|nr:hypothetical protein [Usitatibacter sp.]
MKRAALVAVLALAGCAAQPAPVATTPPAAAAGRVALVNPGFEEPMAQEAICPPGWGCSAHNDMSAFRFFADAKRPASGARSGCVERVGREPWALMTQAAPDIASLRGKHVRFTANVRVEGVVGDGGGVFILAQGGSGQTLAHAKEQRQDTQFWNSMHVDLVVPSEAFVLEVGLVLEGRGMACIDDAVLEVMPGK